MLLSTADMMRITLLYSAAVVCLLTYNVTSEEVIVIDTLQADDQLQWDIYPEDGPAGAQNPTWVFTSWNDPVTQAAHQGITVCSVADEEVDNWMRLPYIDLPDVTNLFVNISFFMRECSEFPGHLTRCRTHFQARKYESDRVIASATAPAWDENTYELVTAIPAAHTYINDNDPNIVANNYTFSFTKARKGVYLAFREEGMCSFILSITVYYKRCPATIIRHTELAAVPTGSSLTTVTGRCVDNAVAMEPNLSFLCTHEGKWHDPDNSAGCVCKPGYTHTPDACVACPTGTYKSSTANEECLPCPANSVSNSRGLTQCPCDSGYFRAPGESAQQGCTQSPSVVRDLDIEHFDADSVTLVWTKPAHEGNRDDLFYTVRCERCSSSVIYTPAKTNLQTTKVTLTNLAPLTSYTVEIIAENGVSAVDPRFTKSDSKSFKTLASDSETQAEIQAVERNGDSLTLSWEAVSGAAAYEVVFSPISDPNSRPLKKRVFSNQVTLDDLEPSKAYNIQVSYYDENNQLIGRTERAPFETTEDKSSPDQLMIGIAIVAVLVCMAIVIAIVVIFLRTSKQQCTDKPHSDCEGLGPYTNVPFHISNTGVSNGVTLPLFNGTGAGRVKTYVDPHTYEDPRQAVKEFTKEIDVSCITIEAVIGGGEFGDVCRGKLSIPNKGEMCVAIKTLKPGASEKNRLDFLTEASIMGQFEDPNVIFLEGVITKSNPIMIVTEYMENGSLDTFLRANDGKLTSVQLLSMLRGISSGMTYLSEMSYIHRDLAARNILVNEHLVCKVADFGLSREVEYDTSEGAYTTRGGKIPVRWTAPEAIAYRKFTSASDVWSFGVVMWEVISYGERPYWNWSNQDVIKAVDRGYRLPPPMECPEAVHQLMLDTWQKDRKNRPKFSAVRNTLDRLMQSPDLLRKLAKPVNQSMIDPEMPNIASQLTVSQWLQLIKMDRYTEAFAQKGVHNMEQVAWLTFADLLEMGVTLVGHQKKIMSSVQALRSRLEGSTSPIHVSEGFLV